ncbi:PREDICTED: vinorine synthase [Prunus dulcis]|uniref:PREDICTED: vinorine synthase n=1 Tax=Prunus dulcis TaxID=3755 RepID=A0A5E4EBX2_PRUDU|nr:PREDICTED: vinorine synthase [Prunus dulcis]
MALLFFATPPMRLQLKTEKIYQQLKKSLSEALTSFYVFACHTSLLICQLWAHSSKLGSAQRPIRVKAATSLIWSCGMNASKLSSGFSKSSMVSHSVNIRKRVVPPLPPTSVGNLVGDYAATVEETGIELKELVSRLRKGWLNLMKTIPRD